MAGQTKATAPVGPATVTGYAASGGALVAGVVSAIAEGADAQTWRLLVAAGVLLLFTNGGRYAQAVVREYAKLRREAEERQAHPIGVATHDAQPGDMVAVRLAGGSGGVGTPPRRAATGEWVHPGVPPVYSQPGDASELAAGLSSRRQTVLDTPPDDDGVIADLHGIGDLPETEDPPPDEGQAPKDLEALR